jgi:DNA-binding transcriptional MerR regulator
MTVRNIRAYQARGLLPPPVVDGRVGFYTEAHRERLTMIRRLRAEGFNLVAISALLTGVVPSTAPQHERPTDPARGGEGGLSDAGAAMLALGVPLDAVLELHQEVRTAVEQVAAAYGRVYEEHLRGPWVAAGSPPNRRYRVAEAATSLPPIATAAVVATLVPAVRKALQQDPSLQPQRASAERMD